MVGRHTEEVRAVDMEVGGDDDMPGIALELTTDDIDDSRLCFLHGRVSSMVTELSAVGVERPCAVRRVSVGDLTL